MKSYLQRDGFFIYAGSLQDFCLLDGPALIHLQWARVSTHRFDSKLGSGFRPNESSLLLGEFECPRLSAGVDPDKVQPGYQG